MPIPHSEYTFHASQLKSLSPRDVTPRLIGFVEWLNEDSDCRDALEELRAVDLSEVIATANPQNPPTFRTPKQVAALALSLIEKSAMQKRQVFQLGVQLGYRNVNGLVSTLQDMEHRLFEPFLKFIENRLFSSKTSHGTPTGVTTRDATNVFVVHGRDNEAKESVARFVEKLGLNAIILHEQLNRGRTIIEKFEEHASVGFAIILLTPDEIGKLADQPDLAFERQARQNVILEMGYFLGKIGRERVFALKRGNVTVPSDYNGVVYTDMDTHGAWKVALVRELKAVGFDVDANKAFA